MNKYAIQEIDPDDVWINISKGMTVRAAVLIHALDGLITIRRGVYKLEDEAISTVNRMVRIAKEDKSIKFYILEETKEE